MRKLVLLSVAGLLSLASSAGAAEGFDFGKWRDFQLRALAKHLFGVKKPLLKSSTESIDQATAEADPTRLVTVAKDLDVRVVSSASDLGPNTDMMVFWPSDQNPSHLIVCNEEDETQPGVQRVRLSDGDVDTILTGTVACDPVRRTPWGTILVAEEAGTSGQAIEIIKPLQTTNVIFDRLTGTASGGTGAENVASRRALGRLSYEGLALYPNGVLYYTDENRPNLGTAGGAFFKFIPTTPWPGGVITDLDQSPFTSGAIYGLRLGKRSGNTDYGQGSNTGLGVWVAIPPGDPTVGQDLRAQAALLKLTGYYRPEDFEVDPRALSQGRVRSCGNNTGNEDDDENFGEALCITDGTLAEATANTAVPAVQYLVIGHPELAMMDNMTFDPERGNWILHEDGAGPDVGRNNDLWSCLEDGVDDDLLSDGCVRVATLNDLNAEWTGGLFDPSGQHFYVSIQHNVTGHGVILEIRDWED